MVHRAHWKANVCLVRTPATAPTPVELNTVARGYRSGGVLVSCSPLPGPVSHVPTLFDLAAIRRHKTSLAYYAGPPADEIYCYDFSCRLFMILTIAIYHITVTTRTSESLSRPLL